MNEIKPKSEFEDLLQQPNAILFLYAEWSGVCMQSADVLEEFIYRWHRKNPQLNIVFSKIDVSEKTDLMWKLVANWLTDNQFTNADLFTSNGNGPLIWIQSGKIVYHIPAAFHLNEESFVEITEQKMMP